MVGISYFIRKNMDESPMFEKAKLEGKIVANPLKESFGKKLNFKFVLLALFGVTLIIVLQFNSTSKTFIIMATV